MMDEGVHGKVKAKIGKKRRCKCKSNLRILTEQVAAMDM